MMYLPAYVAECMEALERAGFAAYAVGGCVRDALLGLTPHDYDLCTAALPEQTEAVFRNRKLALEGKKHGTVSVITEEGPVEITTFRKEGTYGDNRHPDWVEFVTDIEEDLARRDFTVNAMAWSPSRGLVDPYGGRENLENRILRAVGEPERRFREDSLRILRGVRFAVRFGLDLDYETGKAMVSQAGLMDNLARERVWEELWKLLPLVTAEDLQRFAPVLTAVIPELKPMVGFDQHSPYHAYDLYTHTALVTAATPADPVLRWAGLLHDVGKVPTFTRDEDGRGHFYGHDVRGAELAEEILLRLKAPAAVREQVVTLIRWHMETLEENRPFLRRVLSRLGWETTERLLALQRADMGSKGHQNPEDTRHFERIAELLEEIRKEEPCLKTSDLKLGGRDLMDLGLRGKAIGETLEALLELVWEEKVENQRDALITAAKTHIKKEN